MAARLKPETLAFFLPDAMQVQKRTLSGEKKARVSEWKRSF